MFKINNLSWSISFVSPHSKLLQRSNGSYTVGMTDLNTHTIYISNSIKGEFLGKVIRHELCHAYCVSFGIYLPIQYEEILCDALATYGSSIIDMSKCICDNLCKYYGKC